MIQDFSKEKNFTFYHMTDIQYMKRFFCNSKKIYDLVHFDGPHMTKDVLEKLFGLQIDHRKGTRFIFDDYKKFKMEDVAKMLDYWNFKIIQSGENKICLQRM